MSVTFRSLLRLSGLYIVLLVACVSGEDPIRPYPNADGHLVSTTFLDHSSYLSGLDDPQWYLDHLPFVDLPDKTIQDVYYYRASVIKRHLKWVHEGHGWVVTEFIHPVSWALKFQTIPDSVGYHVLETRWLRDQNIAKNLIEAYTRGGVEKGPDHVTFTHFMHAAILEHAQATGNVDFLTSQLDGMISMFNLWDNQKDKTTGLYHRAPLNDAQEYSLPGFLTGGPGGGPVKIWDDFGLSAAEGGGNDYTAIWAGPETYRPNFNAYMIAGARAISTIANLTSQTDIGSYWESVASGLYTKMQAKLWSDDLQFWIDVVQGSNLECQGRELIGYFPYRFDVGTDDVYVKGLEAGLTSERFLTEFGPTTLEQTNPYYTALKNTTYCCVWQGQSWPFSTSIYLRTLAKIARTKASKKITPAFFQDAFGIYARTNFKAGVPYTAESHFPAADAWSGDTSNHSEHYFHSSYIDNVFVDLLGIQPTLGDQFLMSPLIPSNWTHFAVENLPYHGTLLTVVWDETGSTYKFGGHSAGLSIYSNGTLFHKQNDLDAVNVTLPSKSTVASASLGAVPEWQNILANPNSPWGLPKVKADYVLSLNGDIVPYDDWKMNDGLLWYDTTPDNFWTNNDSRTPYNSISITLPRARKITSVSLAIFDDSARHGVIACPAGIRIAKKDGTALALRKPWTSCAPNALNTILLDSEVETDQLIITLNNKLGYAVAVSEIQIWVPPNLGPRWEAEDGVIGTFIGSFEGKQSGLNGTIVRGGVELQSGGWVELSGVRTATGKAANVTLTISGGQTGTVSVTVNWLKSYTVEWGGTLDDKTLTVELLMGGNVVTLFQADGIPWIDAITVS